MDLDHQSEIHVVQRRELAELLIGAETRNKYELRDPSGEQIGFAAEQGKGFLALLARYFMGHWRTFEIVVFDRLRQPLLRALHPFRFFFQRLEISDASGRPLGALQQRWAFFTKRFDVLDAQGQVVLEMRSGLFKVWTFPFFRGEDEVARIEKKWSGILTEAFTDADRFRVVLGERLTPLERRLLLVSAIFVDLQYFEKKASSS
jgi:uncharacterized protein YxjI